MDIDSMAGWRTVGKLVFLVIGLFKWTWVKINAIYQRSIERKNNVVIHLENTIFPNLPTCWSLGRRESASCMQICANLRASNNSDKDITLTGCYIKKFDKRGQILTYNASHLNFDTCYSIPPNYTTKISITFWIEPCVIKAGDDFVSKIAIIDNFGVWHWVKNVKFSYVGNK